MGRKRHNNVIGNISGAVLDKPGDSRSTCHHYWIIEVPTGPTSRGKCKFCGKEKEFDNLGPDSWRYGGMPDLPVPSLPDLTNEGN
jgi:hypothetical protein